MDIYIEKGYLHNDRDIIIAKGPAYCTTAYGNKAEMSRHTTLEWAEIAKYPLDIQLALPRTGKIENFLKQISILTRPLRRKLRVRWFFDVSKVKE